MRGDILRGYFPIIRALWPAGVLPFTELRVALVEPCSQLPARCTRTDGIAGASILQHDVKQQPPVMTLLFAIKQKRSHSTIAHKGGREVWVFDNECKDRFGTAHCVGTHQNGPQHRRLILCFGAKMHCRLKTLKANLTTDNRIVDR